MKERNDVRHCDVPLLHPTTSAEDLYAFPQSPNITYSSGFIGCLKGEFEDNNLFTLWSDAARHLKTDEFVSEMNSVLDTLKEKTLLNRKNMRSYCRSHSSAMMSGKEEQYGFRVDTDQYSYLFRLRVGAHDREIKTNLGTMPIEDYRELVASQRGFDSYADMRRQGYRLPSERNEDDTAEDANREARGAWEQLSEADRRNRQIFAAVVSIDDLADYAEEDGKIDWACWENCNTFPGAFDSRKI